MATAIQPKTMKRNLECNVFFSLIIYIFSLLFFFFFFFYFGLVMNFLKALGFATVAFCLSCWHIRHWQVFFFFVAIKNNLLQSWWNRLYILKLTSRFDSRIKGLKCHWHKTQGQDRDEEVIKIKPLLVVCILSHSLFLLDKRNRWKKG
jgi:hypothetical protein